MEAQEVYDLLILVDATYSMSDYLVSLQTSLPQTISISTLTDCFSRIGLLAYRDYCDKELLQWSGWFSPSSEVGEPEVDLIGMAKKLQSVGGGDGPEATKTGLARAYEVMRADAKTIILLYTDAPPHTFANGSLDGRDSNLGPELAALSVTSSYGGFGPHFQDWVSAANVLSGRAGDKRSQIFCILNRDTGFANAGYYNYLCARTGGSCFYLNTKNPADISKVTIDILLAWMGVEKAGTSVNTDLPAHLVQYTTVHDMDKLVDERDQAAEYFFRTPSSATMNINGDNNITKARLSSDTLKRWLPKKQTAVEDFAKRYTSDSRYKCIVVDQLRKTIKEDVTAISLNPVFGSLWRAVCNDRENEARDELITTFGLEVDRIVSADEKARMKLWLEESYDYTADVLETINSVPLEQRFPCVFLDPTLTFTWDGVDGTAPTEEKAITQFRRDELLEIGRSCNDKILRRLSRVLTQLTYISSADEMPAHIAAASEAETPRIPISLATSEHKRRFWRILLHIVVPGTMLSARPAALLAALSIRLGIQPLFQAARTEMLLWRDRWNNIEIPETWSVDCLWLLLDADEAYHRKQETQGAPLNQDFNQKALLSPLDRALFTLLASYKMLELNLDTTVTAQIGWTPIKSKAPLGPIVICRSCKYPRSVTTMGENGKCGPCLWAESVSEEERRAGNPGCVTKEDTETTIATWVECSVRTCRAQYMVYCPEDLRVRPKCHYCRFAQRAPVVECSVCLSKIIWPASYRPNDVTDYRCHICTSGHTTIVDIETTANTLSNENGNSWLLRNDKRLREPFNKRSLFHTISTSGIEGFCDQVEIFPPTAHENMTLNGKLVRNIPAVITQLKSWISRRCTEPGACSLCFSSKHKLSLRNACGRKGCGQRVCKSCLQKWYGLNAVGRIINTAALSCPFCRRTPRGKMVAKYGRGIHAVVNLTRAVEESGEWIYAWCRRCLNAKPFAERNCVSGAPPELMEWACAQCQTLEAQKAWERIKECPGCGTMTEKTYGCNHIACPVNGCGAHWCFVCGEQCDVGTIYMHLGTRHGGLYDVEGAEWEDVDSDDEGGGWYIHVLPR